MSMKKESPWDVELHLAAARGDAKRLQVLLDSGRVHVDCKDKDGTTPLMLSAAGGHIDGVAELLQQGADPNARRLGRYEIKMDDETEKSSTFPLDPQTEKCITLLLFTNVKNTPEIRQKLISGELECCLLKPALIIDPFQVTVAANKAVCAEKFGELVTKSVFTETLYNLSITKSISKALNLFGSVDKDTEIIVGLIYKEDEKESALKKILDLIQGDQISLSRLGDFSDVERIQNIYKISDTELQVSTLVDSISTRISVKDFVSF